MNQNNTKTALSLPRLISDGMILQRNAVNKIWGYAAVGDKITVDFAGTHTEAVLHLETTADSTEKWETTLTPMKAGGPFTLKVTAADKTQTAVVSDILLGDVWLCSGQSNMELTMDWIDDRYEKEIAACENSMIRAFNVPLRYDFITPHENFDGGCWEQTDPKSILHFSAVAYFFAKQLYEHYHIPIGIINASAGGTPIEAWMSEETLRPFKTYQAELNELKDTGHVNSIVQAEAEAVSSWRRALNQKDMGLKPGQPPYYDNNYDPVDWSSAIMPSDWESIGLGEFYGSVWLRRTVTLTAKQAEKAARFYLGTIIHDDETYLNGVLVGSTPDTHHPRKYKIPVGVLRAGENTLVLRVVTTKGGGGFVKGKPFCLRFADETVDLSGEWYYKIGSDMPLLQEPTYFQCKLNSTPFVRQYGILKQMGCFHAKRETKQTIHRRIQTNGCRSVAKGKA